MQDKDIDQSYNSSWHVLGFKK